VIEQDLAHRRLRCVEIELAAVQAHFVGRTRAITELCNAPGNGNPAVPDPLFDVPTRTESGRSQQLLQPGH